MESDTILYCSNSNVPVILKGVTSLSVRNLSTLNKYLTTNFAYQTIYDDNAFPGFQTRQVIGIGVNYGF